MSPLAKAVLVVLCIGGTSIVAVAALQKTPPPKAASTPTKVAVETAIKMQRNLARVQRAQAIFNNLRMQANQITTEVKADDEELMAFCKEMQLDYASLINGTSAIADDGTLTRAKPPETPLTPPSATSATAAAAKPTLPSTATAGGKQ